jgi:DNA polymerase III gamma/tau subunit
MSQLMRPTRFEDVIGQSADVDRLRNVVAGYKN